MVEDLAGWLNGRTGQDGHARAVIALALFERHKHCNWVACKGCLVDLALHLQGLMVLSCRAPGEAQANQVNKLFVCLSQANGLNAKQACSLTGCYLVGVCCLILFVSFVNCCPTKHNPINL